MALLQVLMAVFLAFGPGAHHTDGGLGGGPITGVSVALPTDGGLGGGPITSGGLGGGPITGAVPGP
jgi:hypothetical protein